MVKLVWLLERIMGDERRMYLVGDLELFRSSSSRFCGSASPKSLPI